MKTYQEVKEDMRNRCRIEVVKTTATHLLSLIVYLVEQNVDLDNELLHRLDSYLADVYNRYMYKQNDETQDTENHCDNNPCD